MEARKKKILVINLTRMGDILQSAPLLHTLRQADKDVHISYLAVTGYSEICRFIPPIDHLIPFDFNSSVAVSKEAVRFLPRRLREIRSFIESLRRENFDEVINLSHSKISALFCHLIGVPQTSGLTLDAEGFRQIRHPWARYFFTANLNRHYNRFNLVDIHKGLALQRSESPETEHEQFNPFSVHDFNLQIPPKVRQKARKLLEGWPGSKTKLKIGLQPGASLACKRWPASSFVRLGQMLQENLDAGILIFGSKTEMELASEVCEPLGENTINLAGKTSIGELGSLLGELDLLITNDTGTQHVAAAVGTPVLSLCFGSALSHETGPYGRDHVVVESSLSCYPCSFHVECSRYRCQEVVTPQLIFSVAEAMLAGKRGHEIEFDDDHLVKDARVWRTDFDSDGFWMLCPAIERPLRASDHINHCSREVWKRILQIQDKTAASIGMLEAAAFLPYLSGYLPPDADTFQLETGEPCAALRSLEESAQAGESRCRELLEAFRKNGDNVEKIKYLSEEIERIDREITVTGFRLPPVNHLVLDFNFLKQNLPGGAIEILIERTQRLYQRLFRIAESFRHGLENWETAFEEIGWRDHIKQVPTDAASESIHPCSGGESQLVKEDCVAAV